MSKVDISSLTKLYYSIGDVSKMFDVNPSLIRFWEKEFSALEFKKTKKGNRQFTIKNIETLNKIYDLVKVKGFTLEGAKKEIKRRKSPEEKVDNNETLIHRLEGIKSKLLMLKSN